MRFDVVSLFPELLRDALRHGVVGRAWERGVVQMAWWNPRDFTSDRHRTVDDRPYGGGPGMVMKAEPLQAAIAAARTAAQQASGAEPRVVYLSPQGRRLDQAGVQHLAQRNLVLVAGRYEGVDERLVETAIDEEWSIGDYVLSGGEFAALVVIDAVARLQPGVLGDDDSARQDSFMDGLLDHPHFTRPEVYQGRRVPAVLLSGDHGAIARWRMQQALGRTWQRRPDLLEKLDLDAEQQALLAAFMEQHEGGGE